MTTHIAHPSTLDVGLQDDCPRCLEHATRPLQTLDTEHLADLWVRMLDVEFGNADRYRTDTERKVCGRLYEFACFLQMCGIPPDRVRPGTPLLGLEP